METIKRLSAEIADNAVRIDVSDRTYQMDGAFPSSILVHGEEILAAPISLKAQFDGQTQPWDQAHTTTVSASADEFVYTVQQAAGNVALNARVRAERDGLIWVDFMMVPFGTWITYRRGEDLTEPHLTSLKLEIPLKKQIAELYHYWPIEASGIVQTAAIRNSGAVPAEGFDIPLKPCLWLGREERGLAFYMESERGAQPANRLKMYQVHTEGDTVILTIDLLDSMPRDWQGKKDSWFEPLEPVEFSLGMQATPVKPYVRQKDFERVFHRNWADFTDMTADELESYCARIEQLGARWHTFHEDWSMIQNYGLAWDEAAFRRVVDALHRHHIRVMVYFGYECSTMIPSWFEKKDNYLLKSAVGKLRGGWQRAPHQRDYMVCYGGDYSDVMCERVAHVMDDYGVDGIYTDSTFIPWECANEAHGCGYRDENGRLHETYPLRKLREHVRRLNEVVHSRGGIVEAHQSSCCVPMILGFADSYFDGEHIQHIFATSGGDFMNTAAIRSEFSGVNFGVPFQFLSITDDYLEGCGLMLLHGAVTKLYGSNPMKRLEEASEIWKIMDEFGTDDARFAAYWQDDCPVSTSARGVLASAWVRENGKVLAVIVNLTKEPVSCEIRCCDAVREKTFQPLIPYFEEF